MMGDPDPGQEPEWEEWMDAPLAERLAPYRYFFIAGCLFLLLPIVFVFLMMLAVGCVGLGTSESGVCAYLP